MPIFSRQNSKFKLVIYLKTQCIEEFPLAKGEKKNMIVEYSIITLDERNPKQSYNRLLRRSRTVYFDKYVTALIYDNHNNQLIYKDIANETKQD